MKGTFLAIEGVDGVGKTTLIESLRLRYEAAGRVVVTVREPGGTTLGEEVRNLLLRREEIEIGAEAQMLLFLSSRVELWRQEIEPALRAGHVVLSDRFHLSTIVYQGIAGELGEARSIAVCQSVLGERRPDLNLVLELPLGVARTRLGSDRDRFEKEDAFLERVATGFATTCGVPGDVIARMSADGTPEEVAARAWQEVARVES